MRTPTLSLIVPTRGRPRQLRRFLRSLAATTLRPSRVEVVLVVDADDRPVAAPGARVVVGPPGRTMGELNRAGAAAARGEWVMLLNDDVVARTRGWDEQVLAAAARFPDRIGLVHVNDTLMRDHLCVFPLVSRRYCEEAGGICPSDYHRYRIDDHIDDVFTRLGHSVYLPDVVFEHRNSVVHPTAGKVYEADPAILAEDAPRFEAHHAVRLQLVRQLGGEPISADAFALRVAGRQAVARGNWLVRTRTDVGEWLKRLRCRLRDRYRRDGAMGVVRRLASRTP
ncbi:MAG: glycosyltransferase [Gemmataceae bacterium]